MFVSLFKRRGSILNNSIFIWNASLSFKQTNKHHIINKNNFLKYFLSNPKEKSENRAIFFVEKRRKCGGCLKVVITCRTMYTLSSTATKTLKTQWARIKLSGGEICVSNLKAPPCKCCESG